MFISDFLEYIQVVKWLVQWSKFTYLSSHVVFLCAWWEQLKSIYLTKSSNSNTNLRTYTVLKLMVFSYRLGFLGFLILLIYSFVHFDLHLISYYSSTSDNHHFAPYLCIYHPSFKISHKWDCVIFLSVLFSTLFAQDVANGSISLLWLSHILLCICATFSLFTHPLMDTLVAAIYWILQITLQWTWKSMYL